MGLSLRCLTTSLLMPQRPARSGPQGFPFVASIVLVHFPPNDLVQSLASTNFLFVKVIKKIHKHKAQGRLATLYIQQCNLHQRRPDNLYVFSKAKEIEIIHRLFLVIAMYFQASSINHSTSHVASWLGRKPRYMQQVAIHQKQPIYYLNFLNFPVRFFPIISSANLYRVKQGTDK